MKKMLTILLCCVCFSAVSNAQSTGEILTFPANPQKGFHWGYALYLPKNLDTSKKLPILLEMNNEDVYESTEELETLVKEDLRDNGIYYKFADGVGVPMLVPLLLQGKEPFHTHQLNRAVFKLQDGPFAHLDKQVLAMLNDARDVLKKRGIRTQKKFLAAGFSTPGVFVWHFTMLQPEHVLAAVVGGHQHLMLPLATYQGANLVYPVGLYDFKLYTGQSFNKKAWKKVPMFVVSGSDDYNDPLPYNHVYGEEERTVFKQLYGEVTMQQIWRKAQEILTPLAPNIQFHTYPNLGHEAIWDDQITFLKTHLHGGPLHAITPTDTSDRPALLPLRVEGLYWSAHAPLVREREYIGKTDLLLKTNKEIPYWVRYKNACKLDILYQGKPILENHFCSGMWSKEKFLQVTFEPDEFARLQSCKQCAFNVRSHHPEILDIPPNLTFRIH